MNNCPNFKTEEINFLFDQGGLGDNIARLPAIRYIKDKYKHVKENVWVPDYFLALAKNLAPDINFRPFSQNNEYNDKIPGRNAGTSVFTNLKTHMVDHAFCILANELPDIKYRNYLKLNTNPISIKKFNLPKKYVVMTTGFTAPIREFLPNYINEVNNFIISKGYDIVFLGQKQTNTGLDNDQIIGNFKKEIDFSKGLNLIDKTNLLEAGKILSNAKTVVGLDCGLGHLAATTDIPIIQSYTSVDPIHRMPYRNNELGWNFYSIVPTDDQPEKFFQSRWDFCFDHDFRISYYNNDDLIKSVTPEFYIEQLEKIL